MKYASWWLIIALLFFFTSEVFADEWYVAPIKGGPSIRVDVKHRGLCANVPNLPRDFKIEVIAPEHAAYTLRAKPVLYWRVNKAVKGTIAITIKEMERGSLPSKPLLEVLAVMVVKPGRHRFPLGNLGVRLEKNVDYIWTVAFVCDRKNRALDLGQSGGIRYVKKPKGVSYRDLKGLAQKGIWYDVFHRATDEQRNSLLKEVGL
jgi:hypothetical protein